MARKAKMIGCGSCMGEGVIAEPGQRSRRCLDCRGTGELVAKRVRVKPTRKAIEQEFNEQLVAAAEKRKADRKSRARKTVAEELTHVVAWQDAEGWHSVRAKFETAIVLYRLLHKFEGPRDCGHLIDSLTCRAAEGGAV